MKGIYHVNGITDLHDFLDVFQNHNNKPLMYETKGAYIHFELKEEIRIKLTKFEPDLEIVMNDLELFIDDYEKRLIIINGLIEQAANSENYEDCTHLKNAADYTRLAIGELKKALTCNT